MRILSHQSNILVFFNGSIRTRRATIVEKTDMRDMVSGVAEGVGEGSPQRPDCMTLTKEVSEVRGNTPKTDSPLYYRTQSDGR